MHMCIGMCPQSVNRIILAVVGNGQVMRQPIRKSLLGHAQWTRNWWLIAIYKPHFLKIDILHILSVRC